MLKGIKKKRLKLVEEKQAFLFNETGLNFMHEEQERNFASYLIRSTLPVAFI